MLNVHDEFSPLTAVAVCMADQVPSPDEYIADHPEFSRYVAGGWDAGLLRRQHRTFVDTLESLGVRVHRVPPEAGMPWQMYTRDVAFVVGSTMYFSRSRGLPEREGEIDATLEALPTGGAVEIVAGPIEGGDVVVHDGGAFVGLGSRTSPAAAEQLGEHVDVETLHPRPERHASRHATDAPVRSACPRACSDLQ